jgi:hypothetical protein
VSCAGPDRKLINAEKTTRDLDDLIIRRRDLELTGHIFYETLPPGILREQIAAGDALTLGNLTLQVKPDIYLGDHCFKRMCS